MHSITCVRCGYEGQYTLPSPDEVAEEGFQPVFCELCGYHLPHPDYLTEDGTPEEMEDEVRVCPACGTIVRLRRAWDVNLFTFDAWGQACPECGEKYDCEADDSWVSVKDPSRTSDVVGLHPPSELIIVLVAAILGE